jgi:hypothetical protein
MKPKLIYTKNRGWHVNDRTCPNCEQLLKPLEAHFVPPSLGQEGFYMCRNANVPEYKLCYIKGDTAYFTTQDLDKQWGDDWNDVPYEHNAGTPYGPSISYFVDGREEKNPLDWNEDGTPRFSLYHLKFTAWQLETPADNVRNSRYSVKDINAGAVAWLRGNLDDGTPIAIPAGASIDEFKQKVRLAGGTIYLPEIV